MPDEVITKIDKIDIKGFRSLSDVEIKKLSNCSVFIGANGSGKSNLLRFFEMLSWMIGPVKLGEYIQRQGGADDQLFAGSKVTKELTAELNITTSAGRNDYRFSLSYAHPDRFIFSDEKYRFFRKNFPTPDWNDLGTGHSEAQITNPENLLETNLRTIRAIADLLRQCCLYQFHDTSEDSSLKKYCDVHDNLHLRSNGGNLAAILLRLEREKKQAIDTICSYINRVLPIFDKFELSEQNGKVILRWRAKGLNKVIGSHLTSDGSLRLFALVTLLNLPNEMLPNVILLDEPELGLHPLAISLIGNLIKSVSMSRQVILATQSPLLVDVFGLEEIFVLESDEGETRVRQFHESEFQDWLIQYSTGELWQKNLLGGRP